MSNQILVSIQLFILLIQVILAVVFFKQKKAQTSTYEADRLFLEIEKTLIAEPKLWEFYNIGAKEEKDEWQQFSDDQKRMFIFCEMNYFYFAFVYREFKRGAIGKEYCKKERGQVLKYQF